MSVRQKLKLPAIALITTLAITAFIVGCGGAGEAPATSSEPAAAAQPPPRLLPTHQWFGRQTRRSRQAPCPPQRSARPYYRPPPGLPLLQPNRKENWSPIG